MTPILERIGAALEAAAKALSRLVPPGASNAEFKSNGDPVTEADRLANRILRAGLQRDGEGWLSEESVDDFTRLERHRVWVVDPLDGTREYVAGIPEWCISVGLVENGRAVAGGICNPPNGDIIVGSLDSGVTHNGRPVRVSQRVSLTGALVLASRSEVNRGEWDQVRKGPFTIQPMGSVAYKLARVAAGLADATWTLTPKNEWDVAAGAALVRAGGGFVRTLDNSAPVFNKESPRFSGLLAGGQFLCEEILSHVEVFGGVK